MQTFNHTALFTSEIVNSYRAGNNAGEGFTVGEETDKVFDVANLGDLVAYVDGIAVYRDGQNLIAVGDAHAFI
jgi:urease gamma subunit